MNNFAIDKKVRRQLEIIKSEKKPSEDILHSLYAQAIIEYSIYQYKKQKILIDIDSALEANDKKRFIIVSEKYKQLLDEYRAGKILYERGCELRLSFDE